MKVATSLSVLAVAGLGLALAGRFAVSSGQTGALVRLQSNTPGVSQAGHQNIAGVLRTGAAQIGLNAKSDASFHVSMFPEVLDQNQNLGSAGYVPGAVWQSFQPGVSGFLKRVEITFAHQAGGTSILVQIIEGEGDGGAVLAQSSPVLTVGPALKSIGFYELPQLEANTTYTLKVVILTGSGLLMASATDVYARGRCNLEGQDLMFRTYMNTPTPRDAIIVSNAGNVGVGVGAPTVALDVNGTIRGSLKQFEIDHPLDPENRVLRHACIESDEIKNLYDGEVTTDKNGFATVTVPDWFEALNGDIRYQLTCFAASDGSMVTANVARPLKGGSFALRTSKPFAMVCWQLTGVRKDKYALDHPLVVEDVKPQISKQDQ